MYSKHEDFIVPTAKTTGAYKRVHKELNEPTLEELSWLPLWDMAKVKRRLERLYKTHTHTGG